MSYWSNNPELLDEITTKFLPTEWREKVETGEASLDDVPQDIHDKAMDEGVRDYWGGLADEAKMRYDEGRLQ